MRLPSLLALVLTFGALSLAGATGTADFPGDCQVLGVWESSPPWFESIVTICAEPDGTHWIRHVLENGSTRVSRLEPLDANRFRMPEDASYDYELLPDGRLAFGNDVVTYQADRIE